MMPNVLKKIGSEWAKLNRRMMGKRIRQVNGISSQKKRKSSLGPNKQNDCSIFSKIPLFFNVLISNPTFDVLSICGFSA